MKTASAPCGRSRADFVRFAANDSISPFAFAAEGQSSDSGEALCGLCRRLEPPYVKATAYGSYDSGLRELIHLLKYNQVRPAANILGRMLVEAMEDLQPLFSASEILVVPVPLHSRKLRQRGFNQSELIARAALKLKSSAAAIPIDSWFVGTPARDEVSDRTLAASAPGKHSGRVRSGKASRSKRTRGPGR